MKYDFKMQKQVNGMFGVSFESSFDRKWTLKSLKYEKLC